METIRKSHLMCIHCDPAAFFDTLDLLSKHLRKKHSSLASFSCGSCKIGYLHKTSLIRHISSDHETNQHSEEAGSSSDLNSENQNQSAVCVIPLQDDNDVCDNSAEENCHDAPTELVKRAFDMKDEAAWFLMDLRSSGNITHASVKLIQDHAQKLISNILASAGHQTSDFLIKCGVPENDFTQFINQTFNVSDPFDGLKSVEEQIHYFSEKFGMVEPEEKFLGTRIENRFDREKRMFLPAQVLETFQYISLIGTLTLIVRNPYLRGLIESELQSMDGVYRSYKDGSDFKLNAFLQKFPNAIRIVFYEDDLEVANVLGAKDVIHKLGCFYFIIQNLPPEISSLLSSIFLLALSYAEDLKKKDAFSKVLTPLNEEIKQLMSDEGVTIQLPEGGSYVLRACIVCFCGDSLAAHGILGFLSPSANRFCRICMISKAEFAEDSTFVGQLRTSAMHRQHVDAVKQDPNCSSLFGVKESSLLMEMMRVPEDSVFDALHDLVGVIAMVLKLALYEFICVRKLFSIHDFNSNVNMFDYGRPDAKNKPSANFMRKKLIGKGHTLKQSGSQTFCLLRVFPFIISGVEAEDPFLELIFLLQDVVKIIFSFEHKDADIERLETLIFQHNRLFHNIFIAPLDAPFAAPAGGEDELEGEETADETEEEEDEDEEELEVAVEVEVRPRRRRRLLSKRLKKGINKLHHLSHYSKQIREKGPIIRLWCARFEARHRIFRKHAAVQTNFKNVPKTMARVFQLSTLGAVLRTGPRAFRVSTTGAHSCHVSTSTYKDLLLANGFNGNDEIQVVKSAEVNGEEYSCGLFVGLKHTGVQPVFAVIMDVVVKPDRCPRVSLVVSKCKNNGLSPRYNAYHIENIFDDLPQLVDVKELANHRPIAAWNPCLATGDDSLYLAPRTIDY